MKFITYLNKMSCLFLLMGFSYVCCANTSQMHMTLARINRLLKQVNPLINLAQQQQDPNTRVKFQFELLRCDISSIQSGITQAMNRVSIQPRIVKPLAGDYLPESEIKSSKKTNHKR